MKRFIAILMVVIALISICGCSQTSINKDENVTLKFVFGDEDISVTLEDEEAKKVIDIIDGKNYTPASSGIPSCSFDKDISIKVGLRVFAIARDGCNGIQDLGNLRFFDIPQEDMEYIHSLFDKYGGYFPCI